MPDLSSRLKQVRESLKMSQTQMSKLLSIGQSTLSQLETGNSSPSFEVLNKLAERADVNLNWLVTGSGDMLVGEEEDDVIATLNVPLIEASAHAGYIDAKGGHEFLTTMRRYKIPGYEDAEDVRLFEIEGDSMRPTFHAGDFIVCTRVKRYASLPEGTLAVVITETNLLLKRVVILGDQTGGIILRSDNPSYEPQIIPLDDVLEIWKVEMKLTNTVDDMVYQNSQKLERMEHELDELKRHMAMFHKQLSPPQEH